MNHVALSARMRDGCNFAGVRNNEIIRGNNPTLGINGEFLSSSPMLSLRE